MVGWAAGSGTTGAVTGPPVGKSDIRTDITTLVNQRFPTFRRYPLRGDGNSCRTLDKVTRSITSEGGLVPIQTVAETLASNIRAYRQLRGLDQAALARRMRSLGFGWRRVTVSEVERNQRNVIVAELLGLTLALDATVQQLVDTRGPEGRRGPDLLLSGLQLVDPHRPAPAVVDDVDSVGSGDIRTVVTVPPADATALVCPHKAYAETEWVDNQAQSMFVKPVKEPVS